MSRGKEEKEPMEIKVTDRRLFDERGELRKDVPERPAQAAAPKPEAPPERPPQRPQAPPEPQAGTGDGEDFSSFLMSLATSALMALGEVPDPETGRTYRHLGAARETIGILEMLHAKTRGNLTPDEKQMMEEILYDLRMRYVSLSKGAAGR